MADTSRTHSTPARRLGPLSLGGERSRRVRSLGLVLTFLKQFGSDQIKQFPVAGPALSGLVAVAEKMSSQDSGQVLESNVETLLDVGNQTREDVGVLRELADYIFVLVADQSDQLTRLLEFMESEGHPAEHQDITDLAAEAALIAYRSRVALGYQYVDYRGISGMTREAHAASLPLDDIYIVPHLQPERETLTNRDQERRVMRTLLDRPEDLDPHERQRLEEELSVLTGEYWRSDDQARQAIPHVGEALKDTRAAVVLGGPGTGKSELIRFLARTAALGPEVIADQLGWEEDLTPVVVSIAEFADARSRNGAVSLSEFISTSMEGVGGAALREAIAGLIDDSRVIFLLDGIDEIPEFESRVEVVREIEAFLSDHDKSRFLITSRPYGYVRLAGTIDHFQLVALSGEQVQEFIRNWQRAFETWQHPGSPDYEKSAQEASSMNEEIQRNDKVAELATNPLMLVIIALIRYEQARLPEERVQLYNRAVNTLMDTWNSFRAMGSNNVGGVHLPLHRLVRVWGGVAEWTRRTRPTGVFHRAELKRKMMEILVEQEYDEDDPDATAESYLNAAAQRAGILEERAPGIFAFWHPTFEEFLSAVEIATPSSRAADRILALKHDPRWREVILLAVGYIGVVHPDPETASKIVEEILSSESAPEDMITQRSLRLAAACVADDVGVRRSVANAVVRKLADAVHELPYQPVENTFVQTINSLPSLRITDDMIPALDHLTEARFSPPVRMAAVRLLGNVAAVDENARTLCASILQEDDDPGVRCHAAFGLARSGESSVQMWSALVGYHDAFPKADLSVSRWFAANRGQALTPLNSLLTEDDARVRLGAARILKDLGSDPDSIVHTLVPLLGDRSSHVRLEAEGVLKEIGPANAELVETLDALLGGISPHQRLHAARILNEFGKEDAAVLIALVTSLDSLDPNVHREASDVLVDIGERDDLVVDALDSLLREGSDSTKLHAAQTLARIGRMGDAVEKTLHSLIRSSDSPTVLSAARFLVDTGSKDDTIVKALVPLLGRNHASTIRLQAAQILTVIGGAGDAAEETLVSLLDEDYTFDRMYPEPLSADIQESEILESLPPFARSELLEELSPIFRQLAHIVNLKAAIGLKKIGSEGDSVIATLFSLLSQDELNLGSLPAQTLKEIASGDDSVVAALVDLACGGDRIAMGAMEKIDRGLAVDDADCQSIVTILRPVEDDSYLQRQAKSILFALAWEKLEAQQPAE